MALLDIIKNPESPVLKSKAMNVGHVDKKVIKTLEDMTDTLHRAGGSGLAAPQVGVPLQLIVLKSDTGYLKLINPIVIQSAGEQISMEGCLSLPGLYGIVRRPEYVLVRALDIAGKQRDVKALGHLAAVISHEIDHLNGILMTDKAIRIVNTGLHNNRM